MITTYGLFADFWVHESVGSIYRWLSLGNQLNGVRLINEGLRARFKASYPEIDVQPPSPPRASATETDNEPMAIDSITA